MTLSRFIKGWLLLAGALFVLVILQAGAALAANESNVIGTKHDLGSAGSPACSKCHIPHKAKGAYLWARTPNTTGGTGEASLCYSCHDGTVTATGKYAFDTAYKQHKATGDCKTCHNAHDARYGKFLTFQAGANFCTTCHTVGDAQHTHPYDIQPSAAGITAKDQVFDPNTNDFSGTRLYNQTGTSIATTDGYIKCLSCHNPHGGSGGGLNTMAYSSSTDSSSPLCQNCH